MRVAAIDIAQKTFGRKLYGLNTEEVYDFLRDLADEVEAMSRAQEQLNEKIKEQEKTLEDFRQREEALQQTLHTAAQMSERIKLESQREADMAIREARQRGDIIIREARDSLRKMYQDINDLKKARMQYEAGLKSLVKAHLAMIEQGHTVVPDPLVPGSEVEVEAPIKPASAAAQPQPSAEA